MTSWLPAELDAIGQADELQITTVRRDGSLRPMLADAAKAATLRLRPAHQPASRGGRHG